jgi:hypothetical protein
VRTIPLSEEHLQQLLEWMNGIKYGSATLIIHDGVVVQIDKSEKLRLK